VYAVKSDVNGDERFKARFVAKGYSQVSGVDYYETFAPTARFTSIRMLMQLAVQEDLEVHQMDVKSAYLNAPIDCDIYMEQPEGFVETTENGKKLVYKLRKSLYGLKQSGRNWNNMLHEYLRSEGFVQSLTDPCVYTRITDGSKVIMIVWVDDIIIAASDVNVLNCAKDSLHCKFKMKDLGEVSWFLGVEFRREDNCIIMTQRKHLERVLNKFRMTDCKTKATPCDLNVNRAGMDDSVELEDPKLYREMVGTLIYIMTGTRPDLCYVVTLLSQHMARPTAAHFGLAKHVFRYLKGSLDFGLKFVKSTDHLRVIGYCDSDWGSSKDRCSISGYGFQLSETGALISWKSQKQRSVALSTCEAEYIALATATQEARFIQQLFNDMSAGDQEMPMREVSLLVDNQGAIALARNPVHHKRSKHIDIKYHFVRSEVQSGFLKLEYIPTERNVADVFTKALSRARMSQLLKLQC